MAYNTTANYLNLVRQLADARYHVPEHVRSSLMGYAKSVHQSDLENRYSEPMVWIGMYIALASFCCILAMLADLLHGLRSRKLWTPCKYFTINAASLTVIAVAMKLPVDLTSPMPGVVDQLAKLGSMAFMCTMTANLVPSLANMDSNALLDNVAALCVLVITLVVNVCIQIRTGVVSNGGDPEAAKFIQMISTGDHDYVPNDLPVSNKVTCSIIAIIYSALLLLLLIIHVCTSLAVVKSKQVIEALYERRHERASKDFQRLTPKYGNFWELEDHVSKHWIMAGSGSPEYIIPGSVTTTASGVICAFTTILHILSIKWAISDIMGRDYDSDYKWTTLLILIVQFIGVVLGTIAPVCRCFAHIRFVVSIENILNHMKVFKVERFWTQKLNDWNYGFVPFPFHSPKLKMIIMKVKSVILNLCIMFLNWVIVVCKIITLIPFFLGICVMWLSRTVLISSCVVRIEMTEMIRSEHLAYVLQVEDDRLLAERTGDGLLKSFNRLTRRSKRKQPKNLKNLIDNKCTVGFQGVKNLDTSHHVQCSSPELEAEYEACWSLAVVTLTTIAVTIHKIEKVEVDCLLKAVREGLKYVTLVDINLNAGHDYLAIQAAVGLWHEVDVDHQWLGIRLKDIASQVTTTACQEDRILQIVQAFFEYAKNLINDESPNVYSRFTSICAYSMLKYTKTIIYDHEQHHKKSFDELILSRMADIMAACLTNLPRVIAMKCHTSVIEKRVASVRAAAKLLAETKEIFNTLQHFPIPDMDPDDLRFIGKWSETDY